MVNTKQPGGFIAEGRKQMADVLHRAAMRFCSKSWKADGGTLKTR